MIWAAVAVAGLIYYLAKDRVAFTWRISWVSAAVAIIFVSSATAGGKVAGWLSGGTFTLLHGIGRFLGML